MVTVSIHELDIADCTKWATEFQNAVFSRPKFIIVTLNLGLVEQTALLGALLG